MIIYDNKQYEVMLLDKGVKSDKTGVRITFRITSLKNQVTYHKTFSDRNPSTFSFTSRSVIVGETMILCPSCWRLSSV